MEKGLTLGEFREQTEDMDDDTLLIIQSHDADFNLGIIDCQKVVVATENLDHIEYEVLDIDFDDDAQVEQALKEGLGLQAITLCANSY